MSGPVSGEYRRARAQVLQLMAQAAVWINTLEPEESDRLLAQAFDDLEDEVLSGRAAAGGFARSDHAEGFSMRVPPRLEVIDGGSGG